MKARSVSEGDSPWREPGRRVTAIIQARMGSTRLPGKVLKEAMGRPLLWHMVQRVRASKLVEQIVVATTDEPQDVPIVELAQQMGVEAFVGSEEDVLDRFYKAAIVYGADPIVRLTADCPLIDPEIVDSVIQCYLDGGGKLDYVGLSGSFPDGLDTEVFSFSALERAWREARWSSEREHVTPYIKKNPQLFRLGRVIYPGEHGHHRWTVDDERDLALVQEIYRRLYGEGRVFLSNEILGLLEREPELLSINAGIIRNEGYAKSLREDAIIS